MDIKKDQSDDPKILNNSNVKASGKRKRRSKNDTNGRHFKCQECGKSYLSIPALTNHRKTKHNYGKDGEKKGRGRPRKNFMTSSSESNDRKFQTFFEKEVRKIGPNQKNSLEFLQESLDKLFKMCQVPLLENYSSIQAHPFYKLLLANWESDQPLLLNNGAYSSLQCAPTSGANPPVEITKLKESLPLDGILFTYLKECSQKTNPEYFWFILKFIFLFRECLNRLRKDHVLPEQANEEIKEYTQIYNGETTPDICNDFISDFMEPNDFFGLDTGELIEIIQHFCYWLYTNHYTTSCLTLL